jgi:serum/glucocorticoid-regulated kinase 2
MDTSNFDTEFTSEAPTDSLSDGSQLSEAMQQQFQGFTFQQNEAIAGSLAGGSVMGPNQMAQAPSTLRQPGGMRRQ